MKKIYIAAGGTGGHINAALSMGEEFEDSYKVTYLTGKRYLDYQLFKDYHSIHLNSKALRSSSTLATVKSLALNFMVFLKVFLLCLFQRPAFVMGAGGYICGPCLLSAKLLGIKVFIIEQNAVVGMTNKLLAKISDLIFTNFETTKGLESIDKDKVKNLGNPIRKSIQHYPNSINEIPNILIFGGSLGAFQINKAMQIILDKKILKDVNILHQTGKGSTLEYEELDKDFTYEQAEFIYDMNEAYKWANIIVARAGASTVSELRIIRKPSILIPFPGATDDHQYYNAQNLKEERIFPCEILDHHLQEDELVEEIVRAVDEMKKKLSKVIAPGQAELVSRKIRKEIELCLK